VLVVVVHVQKPAWQVEPVAQSGSRVQARTQVPLMQASRPHWDEVVQLWTTGGMGRHTWARQKVPSWQSALEAQAPSHRWLRQVSPGRQSLLVPHLGSALQTPPWQPQPAWQSPVSEQTVPGQPKVQPGKPSWSMKAQPLIASAGTARTSSLKRFMGALVSVSG
jgi:hypothetical protein